MKTYQLTKSGLKELKQELEEARADRGKIANLIKTAREFGDLSENAEYSNAIDKRQKNEARIKELQKIITSADVIKAKNATEVEVGNTVELKNGSTMKTLMIVGSVEANPLENKISNESPIGIELLGKKKGDKVAAGKAEFEIMAIS